MVSPGPGQTAQRPRGLARRAPASVKQLNPGVSAYPGLVATAFLVDVFDTLVFCDFRARRVALADRFGVDVNRLDRLLAALAPDIDRGTISVEEAYTQAFAACGAELTTALFDEYHALDRADARLFPDAIPFLEAARDGGVPTALVSNCAAGTREMLDSLGVLALVDVAVLSCEIGHAKPSAQIYQAALDRLGVPASAAVFVDDQLRYCDGAVAIGVSAVQIARPGTPTRDGFPVVRSLLELIAA
jgi:HAD superfamily hydrolase (TIGR01509 family)